MKKIITGVSIELVKGNITAQPDLSAIVNAANAWLQPGGGVAGAIHRAAGPGLAEECKPLAPIKPGQAVITSGHDLPNKYVIHCLGPVFGVDEPSAAILTACYESALSLGEKKKLDSIGFPAISTGVFGYPVEAATEVALKTVMRILPALRFIKRIRFVLFDNRTLKIYEAMLGLLLSEASKGMPPRRQQH
jgi:O-acetyl-ADP-ribose deacetylase (regulator of RNase III)